MAERDIYGRRDYPHRNTIDMTSQDYHTFLAQLEIWLRKAMTKFNLAWKKGIHYPYAFDEFDTEVEFSRHGVNFVLKNKY